MKLFTFFIGVILFQNVLGQDFHAQVNAVYNFIPHEMSEAEQKNLYPKLDKFFDLVTKNKAKYLEPLRAELLRNDHSAYFYYDGGILLMEMSKSAEDLQLIADVLTKADTRDIPSDVYLKHLLRLSMKGANVIEAALHILDDSTFQAIIPEHALSLKYGEALNFILPRYPSDLYTHKLISKFAFINSTANKLTCLELFVHSNCCEADQFLASLVADEKQPKQLRDKVKDMINTTTVPQKTNTDQYLSAFNKRKKVLNRISDEAMDELYVLTLEMRKWYACKE